MYRLLSTGTLEESVFQRQIFKGALYDLIHNSNEGDEGDNSTSRQERRQEAREGGGSDCSATAAVAAVAAAVTAAATKGGAGQSSRGFSQEELKELFVLKTATRSDTYDKLRRGWTAAAATATATTTTTSTSTVAEGGRYGLNTADESDQAAAAGAVVPADEAWKDYGGPSEVLDEALRLALLAGGAGGGGGESGESSANSCGSTASSAVTFVREVRRGGRPK